MYRLLLFVLRLEIVVREKRCGSNQEACHHIPLLP